MNLKKIRWSIVDWLLICLMVVYIISATANGHKESFVFLQMALPYANLYFLWKILYSSGVNFFPTILLIAIYIWSCIESFYGLQQVFGFRPSRHSAFGMTGSFSNPGPYGGFMATTLSIAIAYALKYKKRFSLITECVRRIIRKGQNFNVRFSYIEWMAFRATPLLLAAPTIILGILVLPASRSRAGWVGIGIALIVYATINTKLLQYMRSRKIMITISVIIVITSCFGIFMIKKDSALGRLHIWNIELRAIAKSPIIGYGPGFALGAYGKSQEEYFRNASRQENIIRIAGCPEYAFNEYLKVGMETGIFGLLISICLITAGITALLKIKSPLAYGLIAASTFAFFSYPSNVTQLSLLATGLLSTAGSHDFMNKENSTLFRDLCFSPVITIIIATILIFININLKDNYRQREDAIGKWMKSRSWSSLELFENSVKELEPLYSTMSWNFRYVYDYGYALHRTGQYEQSNAILKKGAELSSDPMFHYIIGKNMESLEKYEYAEKEFITSHYIVPCRIYPLILLMEMYEKCGKLSLADSVQKKIETMPVNKKNKIMSDLKEKSIKR